MLIKAGNGGMCAFTRENEEEEHLQITLAVIAVVRNRDERGHRANSATSWQCDGKCLRDLRWQVHAIH